MRGLSHHRFLEPSGESLRHATTALLRRHPHDLDRFGVHGLGHGQGPFEGTVTEGVSWCNMSCTSRHCVATFFEVKAEGSVGSGVQALPGFCLALS